MANLTIPIRIDLPEDWVEQVVNRLKNDPESEWVQIVRCKDCKHYNAGFECLIEGYGIERDEDWYCADAERRTDE